MNQEQNNSSLPNIEQAILSLAKIMQDSSITLNRNPYVFSVARNTSAFITTGSALVTMTNELFDPSSMFASSRFTALVGGYYQINAGAALGSSGTGTTEHFTIILKKNGTNIFVSQRMNGSGDANRLARQHLSSLVYLAVGDYIELWYDYVGGSRDLYAGSELTYMNGFLVTAA